MSEKAFTQLPPSLRLNRSAWQPVVPYPLMDEACYFQRENRFSIPSGTSGLEVVDDNTTKVSTTNAEVLTRRQEGMQRTKDIIYEQIANNQFPVEESDFIIRCLEKRADASVRQTYHNGKRLNEISETAVIPKIAMTFMAGADAPQVNRMEQVGMADNTPDQKTAIWRVNTAGTLLHDFEVNTDLSIIQSDNTSQVVARSCERILAVDDSYFASNIAKRALISRKYDNRTVTIHSDYVKIVNDLSAGKCDLEGTLIEVDGSSLTNLIVNYRHLIHRGGPALTFSETIKLLDVMIEDARRLCIRSPILFRMSTRCHIMSSKNTRYGVDHGLMFRTLTTSRGIKNIISLSASYFNALSTSGDRDKSQDMIRPKFLQMLVLLLSLLNDEDLSELKEFLETTYRMKADRQSLELLILKVLPLMSINSKVFMKALLNVIDGSYAEADLDLRQQGKMWNIFVQRLLHLGYIVPGTVAQLGQTDLSWVIKWPKEGIKDSHAFRNLQYGGRSRTMNTIPPLELSLDATLDEVTVILTNGARYMISHEDLEHIICMNPGHYTMADTLVGGRTCDLEINEVVVNSTLYEAIFRLNEVISDYNSYLSAPRPQGSMLSRLASLREKPEMTSLKEIKGSGRLTRNVAKLDNHILAVAYKVEGRKITCRDLLRHIASDIKTVIAVARVLEAAMRDFDTRNIPSHVRDRINRHRHSLAKIREQVAQAQDTRNSILRSSYSELADEPISKVLYPNDSQHASGPPVWHEYRSWYVSTENTLYVEAQRDIVKRVRWITDAIVEVCFGGLSAKYMLSPLTAVTEAERSDEIRSDDNVLLVGQYVVVIEPGEESPPQHREAVTNWMKVIGVEQYPVSKRGMNRRENTPIPRWTLR